MTLVDDAFELTRNAVEGFALAFEKEPEKLFTGAQVAETLRESAKRLQEDAERVIENKQ